MPKGVKGFVKGQKFTEEHREKLSDAHRGRVVWNKGLRLKLNNALDEWRENGGISWNKGKEYKWGSHSLESRQKMSKIAKEKILAGKHNLFNKLSTIPTNTRRSIKVSPEYKYWRKCIYERDDYTCQECGDKNGNGHTVKLNAHHIKPFAMFPELIYALDNGITLCEKCHRKTDSYGTKIFKLKKVS